MLRNGTEEKRMMAPVWKAPKADTPRACCHPRAAWQRGQSLKRNGYGTAQIVAPHG